MKFVSVVGFGGAFDLAATQEGLEMAGRKELPAGFGAANIMVNRHLLGEDWDTQIAYDGSGYDWSPVKDTAIVIGNPPCSGFSTLTQTKGFRGIDSEINKCMWALVDFAGRSIPEVVIFESVQGAFFQGVTLMRDLRAKLEEVSGRQYGLYHVLHNNASLGGAANRKRYFFVASAVPFGVEHFPMTRVPTLNDILEDLEPLSITWERQVYNTLPNWWTAQMRDGTGAVDGMEIVRSPTYKRGRFLAEAGMEWKEGETVLEPTKRYYEKFGDLPITKIRGDGLWKEEYWTKDGTTGEPVFHMKELQRFIRYDWQAGPNSLMRWPGNRPARVVTGGGCYLVWHPHLSRTLTQREVARIQGFPDSWKIEPLRHMGQQVAATWGKGIPVHSGRWIAKWAKESIEGRPGAYFDGPWPDRMKNQPREAREYIIDVTNDWKKYPCGN